MGFSVVFLFLLFCRLRPSEKLRNILVYFFACFIPKKYGQNIKVMKRKFFLFFLKKKKESFFLIFTL